MKYPRHIQAWLTAQYLPAFEIPVQGTLQLPEVQPWGVTLTLT